MLVSFPSDILALILHGSCSSYLVLTLWKCGNGKLNRKLAASITYLDLCDASAHATSSWPTLIAELRELRYLSINRFEMPICSPSHALSAHLQTLSPTLRTLKISCKEASHSLYQYDPKLGWYAGEYERGVSRYFDMCAIFPQLETLEVTETFGAFYSMCPTDFAALPPSLTSLKMPPAQISASSRLDRLCPSGLIELNTMLSSDASCNWKPFLDSLPSTVTRLGPFSLDGVPTSLQGRGDLITEWYGPASHTLLRNLPSSITKLGHWDEFTFDPVYSGVKWEGGVLPHLTSLDLPEETTVDYLRDADSIALLPKRLMFITGKATVSVASLADAAQRGIDVPSVWPPNLHTLEVSCGRDSPDKLSHFLPKTLKSLRIYAVSGWSYDETPDWSGLERLALLGRPIRRDAKKSFTHLPESLTSLELEWLQDDPDQQSTWMHPPVLPSKLVHLCLDNWRASWFSHLPKTLIDLNLRCVEGLEELLDRNKTSDPFNGLPHGLKFLVLGAPHHLSTRGPLPDSSFSSLQSLRILLLGLMPPLGPGFFQTMPKRLYRLSARVLEIPRSADYLLPPMRTITTDLEEYQRNLMQHLPWAPSSNLQDIVRLGYVDPSAW